MNKEAFLLALYDELSGLPVEDKERSVAYYREMIDDRVEEGLSEEEAVAALGPMDEIVREIVGEMPLSAIVRNRVAPQRSLRAWEIALLVLGSPLWLPLALTAFILLLAVYIVIWAAIVSLFAALITLAAGGVVLVAHGVVNSGAIGVWGMLMALGMGVALLGATLLLWSPATALVKALARLTGRFWGWIKRQFVKRGGEKR
ncbi:MAG: DUF1700 domain-containing protein [Oscillospiraceae bacterium]|nr:DUF1700 domain-containing protein [Oscillospiraceae bacterium]